MLLPKSHGRLAWQQRRICEQLLDAWGSALMCPPAAHLRPIPTRAAKLSMSGQCQVIQFLMSYEYQQGLAKGLSAQESMLACSVCLPVFQTHTLAQSHSHGHACFHLGNRTLWLSCHFCVNPAPTPKPHALRLRWSAGELDQTMADAGDSADVMQKLYAEMPLEKRFPSLSGHLLVEKIFEWYQRGQTTDVPWFVDGAKAVVRGTDNFRNQSVTDARLLQSVLEKGIVPGVRGEPWLVLPQGGSGPREAITYGGLSNAFYKALELQPDNPQVHATLKAGLRSCRLLDARIPVSVRKFLKDYHNRFHSGSSYSFVELLTDVVETIEPAWEAQMFRFRPAQRFQRP